MRKTSWMKQSRQENLIYLAVWGLLFAAPLLSLYVRTASDADTTFEWTEVFVVWRRLTTFLLLFLVHNFLLAPLSVHSHRRVAYFTIVAVLIAVFAFFQFSTPPDMKKPMGHRPPPRMETPRARRPPSDKPRPPGGRHHMPPPVVGERELLPVAMLLLMFVVAFLCTYIYHFLMYILLLHNHIHIIQLYRINYMQILPNNIRYNV